MAQLPTRDSLGQLPSARGGGGIARVSVPNMTGVGAGVSDLGRGVAAIGQAAEVIQNHENKKEEFETERGFQEFEFNQGQALDQSMRSIQPGQADGFQDGWQQAYVKSAGEFFKNIPDHLKPKYEEKLFRAEQRLYGTASTFARTEQRRFSTNSIDDAVNNIYSPRARVATTDELPRVTTDFDTLVDANPHLTPIEKDQLKRKGQLTIGLAHVQGLPPEQRINLLRQPPMGREQVLDRIERIESGGDPTARATTSSATGAFQFTNRTWLDTIKVARPDIAQGRSDSELLELRLDRNLSREMAGHLMDSNAKELQGAGVPVNSGSLYLAHFLGVRDATNVMKAEPGTPVADVIGRQSIGANRSILHGKTTDSVIQWASSKMGGGAFSGAVAAIPAQERVKLMERAEVEIVQTGEAQRVAQERQRKLRADELMKEAFARWNGGELTAEFIEQIRPQITSAEYKNLLKTFSAEENVDDRDAVADLVKRLDTESPDTFQRIAGSYMAEGKLKTSTYISLSEKNRVASRDDQPQSPYRSGRDLVRTTLDPGQLLSGSAAAIARQGMGQALVEFDAWSEANPRATRADATAMAQDIVKRYSIIDTSEMRLATGASRYFGAKAKTELKIEDVDAARQNLMADILASRLTKAQQDFEIRLLDNWRAILSREEVGRQQQDARPKR